MRILLIAAFALAAAGPALAQSDFPEPPPMGGGQWGGGQGGGQGAGGGEQQGLDPAFNLGLVGLEGQVAHGVSSSGWPFPRRFRNSSAKACAWRMSMAPSFTNSRLADSVEAV